MQPTARTVRDAIRPAEGKLAFGGSWREQLAGSISRRQHLSDNPSSRKSISPRSEVCSVNISRPYIDLADWSVHDPTRTEYRIALSPSLPLSRPPLNVATGVIPFTTPAFFLTTVVGLHP